MVAGAADAGEYKDLDEPLRDFIKRKGGQRMRGAVCRSSWAIELAAYRPKPAFCAPKSIL